LEYSWYKALCPIPQTQCLELTEGYGVIVGVKIRLDTIVQCLSELMHWIEYDRCSMSYNMTTNMDQSIDDRYA
jgi:hypothetical protein